MGADVSGWSQAGLEYSVDDNVAWLRLNRPEKRNALDHFPAGNGPGGIGLRDALLAAIHEATEDNSVRAAVITGNGTVFCSGADITQEGGPNEIPPHRRRGRLVTARDNSLVYGWYRMMEAIWRSETPFIAGVNGAAVGGGCQLALACDFVIASDEASFWEIFVRRGLPLEGGGAWLLTHALSPVRAKEVAMLGEPLPAKRAEEWGLVNRCVPKDELDSTLREWAQKLATLTLRVGGPVRAQAEVTLPPDLDLSPRVGQIKGQLHAAYEQSMWQTFREEATLLPVLDWEQPREPE